MKPVSFVVGLVLSALLLITPTDGIAVMSVDLGTEWMKIAIVSPGVPMEIVLNKESKRKTPVAVSFRNGEREFSEPALGIGIRFPDKAYRFMLDLIGKKIDNPMVKLFQKRFPYYNLTECKERNTILFEQDGEQFSPEELIAMILSKARDLAQDFSGQNVKDMVITVPAFFNQAERRAILQAADLAGLKLLQLLSDNAAVALNYGIFRRKDFNTTTQRIMFYDMGAASTVVTIVGYQLVQTKEKGYKETNPQLNILGVGYDRTLGGLEMTLRLQDHLAKKFNEQKIASSDVFKTPRAMAKLLKEAERVKMVLSANLDHAAQIEGLLEEKDFKLTVTRAELEEMCEDLFARVNLPVKMALKEAEMTMDDIDQVILFGGSTRVPRVQDEILKVTKKSELGKNINTDEAAAMGAVYQAAHLSQGFKVKRFIIKESVMYPIHVKFEREMEPDEGEGVKTISRALFSSLNPYPQKKVMTFNRHVKDFAIHINYGDLTFPSDLEKESFGALNISTIQFEGIVKALDKHASDGSETKGVKAHFRMDENGILLLDQVESVFETKSLEDSEQPAPETVESTLSKLGSTISKLFSGSSPVEEDAATPDTSSDAKEMKAEEDDAPSQSQPQNQTGEETPSTDEKNENVQSNVTADEKLANETAKNETKKVDKKVVVKEPIEFKQSMVDLLDISTDHVKISKDKLTKYNQKEKEKHDREEAHNLLESFLLETRDKLYQSDYEVATTEEERETLIGKLNENSDWLDETTDETPTKLFREKLSSIKSAFQEVFDRVKEHKDRPEALQALTDMLNMSQVFMSRVRNMSEDDQYFTEVEITTLEKLIEETKEWKKNKMAEQVAIPLFKKPILTVRSIAEKISTLDREVKYLVNKARTAKPKPKKTESDKANTTDSNTTKTTVPESKSESETKTEKETEESKTEFEEPVLDEKPQEKEETETGGESENEKEDILTIDDSIQSRNTSENMHTEL